MKTTTEIARRLIELCRKADFLTAQKELYAEEVVSIEPHETPAFPKETKGLKAVNEKIQKFTDMTEELYSIHVSEPLIATNAIAIAMTMDIKMKEQNRSAMSELCVYEVKEGKIVSENFFM